MDIVERLRDLGSPFSRREAADEIERLRGEMDRLQRAYEQLRETYLASKIDKDDGDHRFAKDTYS